MPRVRWIAVFVGVMSPTILIGLWQVFNWVGVSIDLAMIPGLNIAIIATWGLVLTAPIETRLKLLLTFVAAWAIVLQVFLFWGYPVELPIIAI